MHKFSLSPKISKTRWKEEFFCALIAEGLDFTGNDEFHSTVILNNSSLVINLIDLDTPVLPEKLIEIQNIARHNGLFLIQLWEDVWLSKPEQVLFRLKSLSGRNVRIHGRKTTLRKITKPEADVFLDKNHLQGTVTSRYKFGLFFLDELVAVATFSASRTMNHTAHYKSVELIRFAAKGGYSITGGLSKMLKGLQSLINPSDIMTYADRDWSGGEAYFKLGFNQVACLKPQYFTLDADFKRKIVKGDRNTADRNVCNTGSLKFILKF